MYYYLFKFFNNYYLFWLKAFYLFKISGSAVLPVLKLFLQFFSILAAQLFFCFNFKFLDFEFCYFMVYSVADLYFRNFIIFFFIVFFKLAQLLWSLVLLGLFFSLSSILFPYSVFGWIIISVYTLWNWYDYTIRRAWNPYYLHGTEGNFVVTMRMQYPLSQIMKYDVINYFESLSFWLMPNGERVFFFPVFSAVILLFSFLVSIFFFVFVFSVFSQLVSLVFIVKLAMLKLFIYSAWFFMNFFFFFYNIFLFIGFTGLSFFFLLLFLLGFILPNFTFFEFSPTRYSAFFNKGRFYLDQICIFILFYWSLVAFSVLEWVEIAEFLVYEDSEYLFTYYLYTFLPSILDWL